MKVLKRVTALIWLKTNKSILSILLLLISYNSFIYGEELSNTEELLVAFTINKVPRNHIDIVLKKNNELYISKDTLEKFNFKIRNRNKITYYKKDYYKLDRNLSSFTIIPASSTIEIVAKPEAFEHTIIEPQNTWFTPDIPQIGGYLNYDIVYSNARKPSNHSLQSLLNPTIFYKQNIITSDFKTDFDKNNHTNKLIRLETKILRDFPDKLTTLTIGDDRTYADLWGRPVLFAGLHYATNFSLQPGFLYYPVPDITGVANLPSAVELYINDVNRQRKNIQEGPFEILEIPTINGGGEIQVIQQDILGREKIYNIPYYLSLLSLKPGVKEYSYSIGTLRSNFATQSNSYRKYVATANYKQGVTNNFTYALRAEAGDRQQAIGARTTLTHPYLGELSLVTAGSNQDLTQSGLGGVAKSVYIRQFKAFNFNITLDAISKKYIEIGQNKNTLPYNYSAQAFVGIPIGYNNSISMNYIHRNNRTQKTEDLLSANYFHNFKKLFNLTITTQFDLNNTKRKVIFINFVKAFDNNTTTSIASNIENDEKTRYLFTINKGTQEYNDIGYSLRASHKETTDILADIRYNNPYNTLRAEFNYINNKDNYRLSTQGGFAYLDSNIFMSRPIQDSFAIVNTSNLSNINVYHNNRLITKTNNSGKAIIPNLISFQANKISIDPGDLDLDTKFNTSSIDIRPYRYTGNAINYDITKSYSLMFKLINTSNSNSTVPTGAHITDSNKNLLTLTGFDGFVYLSNTNNKFKNKTFYAQWPEHSCKFTLNKNADSKNSANSELNLGEIACIS